MNVKKPMFLEHETLKQNYYEPQNPYEDAPVCYVNLLELLRYTKKCRKKLKDLSKEEVQKFII